MKKLIYIVVGTRPNFIKVTQFKSQAEKIGGVEIKIIHTGQHYDAKMADVFFQQFRLEPDYYLNIKPASPNTQMAEIMIRLEQLILEKGKPDLLIVVGDVNSTLAAAITANKMGLPLAHLESGLRSLDRTMPEEINRLLTDEISDFYFVTEESGIENLLKEGKPENKIHFVGNTMIDTLVAFERDIDSSDIIDQLSLKSCDYVLMTMHRPATVDDKKGLSKLLEILKEISAYYKVVFPIHPRTANRMKEFGLDEAFNSLENLVFTEPLDYFNFQKLIKESGIVITDSGGIQEETTFLKKPCLTLRPNTERPVTCKIGTNTLLDLDTDQIIKYVKQVKTGEYKKGEVPKFWDGKATERILLKILNK